jgi:hypothetical protein
MQASRLKPWLPGPLSLAATRLGAAGRPGGPGRPTRTPGPPNGRFQVSLGRRARWAAAAVTSHELRWPQCSSPSHCASATSDGCQVALALSLTQARARLESESESEARILPAHMPVP